MARTEIEWAESSWNPIRGSVGTWACVKVSPGCAYCYAERMSMQQRGGPAYLPGKDAPRLETRLLHEPAQWKRPQRIFVCSMSDVFWEAVADEWVETVFERMLAVPRHTYLLLTKRTARMRAWITDWLWRHELKSLPPCIWPGTSIENQAMAELRLPDLVAIPAAVRWVSCEPLLGPIDLSLSLVCHRCGEAVGWIEQRWRHNGDGSHDHHCRDFPKGAGYCPAVLGVQWVVAGGESGGSPGRRLVDLCSHVRRLSYDLACLDRDKAGCPRCQGTGWRPKPHALDWARSLRDQCAAAEVPFLWKQWGGPAAKSGGRLLDGVLHHALPDMAAAAPRTPRQLALVLA